MVTATVAILAVFFAIGSVSPLLLADDLEQVIDLEPQAAEEQL